ncbi:hypothetical protein EIP91_007946 [Steccherinum ochraceum]|uniref:F-box domain-containing protein n=1 Tax=Steccherinum ochraceum TaxID=92696 RepID=A0A4R0R3P8_9APHY|nr:hypothetical protein EIP91_007946 [Steccherinum ochraceum]
MPSSELVAVKIHTLRLAVEIWENIIDFVAYDDKRRIWQSRLTDILSCCLVCRSWFPRSRFHLELSTSKIELHSQERLLSYARYLRQGSSDLTAQVNELRIKCSKEKNPDVSWVSLVPHRLPRLTALTTLIITGFDLSKTPAHFYQAYSLFGSLERLEIDRCKVFRFSQVTSLASAMNARRLTLGPGNIIGDFPGAFAIGGTCLEEVHVALLGGGSDPLPHGWAIGLVPRVHTLRLAVDPYVFERNAENLWKGITALFMKLRWNSRSSYITVSIQGIDYKATLRCDGECQAILPNAPEVSSAAI